MFLFLLRENKARENSHADGWKLDHGPLIIMLYQWKWEREEAYAAFKIKHLLNLFFQMADSFRNKVTIFMNGTLNNWLTWFI